jgi:hypothetical protein
MRILVASCIALVAGGLVACSGPVRVSPVGADVVRGSDKYRSTVVFDLRDDSNPSCALLLHETPSADATPVNQIVLLPFPTTGAEKNREIFTAWSSLGECCSIVSYVHMPDRSGPYTVALTPAFSAQPGDLSDLPGQVYFLRLGQERRFIYKYGLPSGSDDLTRLLSSGSARMPEVVAVARPVDSKGLEVRAGMTESPTRRDWNGVASFYSATVAEAGTDHLEIRYELPLSSAQELAVKFLGELLAALAPPFVSLVFLDLKDPSKRRRSIVTLTILIAIEAGVLAGIGYFAWKARTTQTSEALLSAVVVLAGLAFTVVAARLKKKGSPEAGEV